MHFSATDSASIKIIDARFLIIIANFPAKIKAYWLLVYELLWYCRFFDARSSQMRTRNILFDAHFLFMIYNNFPNLFIISTLCSSKEWAYRLSVIVAFLCPNSSERVFTSIPHSIARVANVWRSEWKPLCGIFSFFSRNSNVRWYERIYTGLSPSAMIYSHFERFLTPFSRDNICFGNGITLREWTVFGLSIMRIWFIPLFPSWQVFETKSKSLPKSISSHVKASNSPMRKPV